MINRGPQGRRTDGRTTRKGERKREAEKEQARICAAPVSPATPSLLPSSPREQMRKDECREGGKEKRLFIQGRLES